MPDQININITDTIPPENFATVDAGAKVGTVYTKEQDNAWRKEVESVTQSGIKGVLKPNTPYDAVTNPYPTPWAQGDSLLYEKYDVNQAGTFPNTKDINDENIVVTQNDIDLFEVQIWIKNGIAQLYKKAMPQASVNLIKWSDIQSNDFPKTEGFQAVHDGSIWIVADGKIASSTDVPGSDSLIWLSMSDLNKWEVDVDDAIIDITSQKAFKQGFFIESTGNEVVNSAWQHSDFIVVSQGDKFKAKLRGDNGAIMCAYYTQDSFSSFVSVLASHSNSGTAVNTEVEFIVPSDGFVIFQNRSLDYNNNDLFIHKVLNKIEYSAQMIVDDMNDLRTEMTSKWLVNAPTDSYTDITSSKSYAPNERIVNGTSVESNIAWERSNFIVVSQGDKFKAKLRGDNSSMMCGLYSSNNFASYVETLAYHANTIDPPLNTEVEFIVPSDGFVIFQNRPYQYAGADLYIHKFSSEQIEYSAQDILDEFKSNEVRVSETFYYVERPKFARIDFRGALPTDETPARTPTSLDFDLSINGRKIMTAKSELSIQGHASAVYPKKGYTFDVFNVKNESLKIKFGDMIATDSFHLKAYVTDRTHTRDVGMGRVWRDMISLNNYPISKVNNIQFNLNPTESTATFISDAKYHTDGFPVEVYVSGAFQGLYTLRLKKTRENYALNNKDKKHIFLDSYDYGATLENGFNPVKWELKSPKITGYEAGGVVSDTVVNSSIQRFFNWMVDFRNNIGTARADYAQYIVLENWIDYCILVEAFDHRDSVGNNQNLLTWDGLKWSWCPYDMDNSVGLDPWANYTLITTKTGFSLSDIWTPFRTVFAMQIKARYTTLRNNGFLTSRNLEKYFDDISKAIPRSVRENDRAKWANIWTNGYPTEEHIKLFLNNRLNWLDSQWLS